MGLVQDLPHEYVPPDMLQKVANHGATNKIYACEVSRRDHLVRINGGPFDAKEYDEYPNRYISVFSKKVAPHLRIESGSPSLSLSSRLDRPVRFRDHQRHLLGAELAQADHNPRRQAPVALGAESLALGADVDRFAAASAPSARHMRHQ